MIQFEFELDTLENVLKEISSQKDRLTHHILIASKSNPDMRMYHEAIMATGKQDFCDDLNHVCMAFIEHT